MSQSQEFIFSPVLEEPKIVLEDEKSHTKKKLIGRELSFDLKWLIILILSGTLLFTTLNLDQKIEHLLGGMNEPKLSSFEIPNKVDFCMYGQIFGFESIENITILVDDQPAYINNDRYFIALETNKPSLEITVLQNGICIKEFLVSVTNDSIREEIITINEY